MYSKTIQMERKHTNMYNCNACNKNYTKKSSLEKHKILCNFKMKTKRENQIENEEIGDMPTHAELVAIVQELTLKMLKMEEKMAENQQWIERKKKKINVITWLNANINPTVGFIEWVKNYINVNSEHFEYLLDNDLCDTIHKIFIHNLSENNNFIYPMRCFTQKSGIFYIAEKKEDGKAEWRLLTSEDMNFLLKTIQNYTTKILMKWKIDNQQQIDDNIKISNKFHKAIGKLYSIFIVNNIISKIKNNLFDYLKTDLKNIIEHEIE